MRSQNNLSKDVNAAVAAANKIPQQNLFSRGGGSKGSQVARKISPKNQFQRP